MLVQVECYNGLNENYYVSVLYCLFHPNLIYLSHFVYRNRFSRKRLGIQHASRKGKKRGDKILLARVSGAIQGLTNSMSSTRIQMIRSSTFKIALICSSHNKLTSEKFRIQSDLNIIGNTYGWNVHLLLYICWLLVFMKWYEE